MADKVLGVNPDFLFLSDPDKEDEAINLIREALSTARQGEARIVKPDDSVSVIAYHDDIEELFPYIKMVIKAVNNQSKKVDIYIGKTDKKWVEFIFEKKRD